MKFCSNGLREKNSKMNPFPKVEQLFSFKLVSVSPGVTMGEEIRDIISRAMGDC